MKKYNIAFIHPDLGIGGAERLVVDAAVGLKSFQHNIHIVLNYKIINKFTSHHDKDRCFKGK
jgi:alpha-1,3/alpha-1,6-mannosyltransferase